MGGYGRWTGLFAAGPIPPICFARQPPNSLDCGCRGRSRRLVAQRPRTGLIRARDQTWRRLSPGPSFGDRQARALEPDPAGTGIWIGFGNGGVARFTPSGGTDFLLSRNGLGGGEVTDLHLSRDGTLWIATDQGLSALRGGHLATVTTAGGMPCDRIHAMVEDDDGALWLNSACGLVRIAASELAGWTAHPNIKIKSKTFGASDGCRAS